MQDRTTQRPGRGAHAPMTVDAESFRLVMGHFATGVTVVTTMDGERPVGITANSVSSVSLDPPLVMVALDHRRRIVPAMRASRRYAVNILGEDQQALSDCFAGAPVAPDREAFCGAASHPGPLGMPLIEDAVASFECELADIHAVGDHELYIGRVVSIVNAERHPLPLLYYRRHYLRIERAHAEDLRGKPEG